MEFSFDEKAYKAYAKHIIFLSLPFWIVFIVIVCVLYFAEIRFERPWELANIVSFSFPVLYSFGQIYRLISSYFHPNPSLYQSRLYVEEDAAPPLIRMIPQKGDCTVEYRIRSIRKFKQTWRGIIVHGDIIETTTFDSDIRKDKEALIRKRVLIPAYLNSEAVLPHIARMADLSAGNKSSDFND